MRKNDVSLNIVLLNLESSHHTDNALVFSQLIYMYKGFVPSVREATTLEPQPILVFLGYSDLKCEYFQVTLYWKSNRFSWLGFNSCKEGRPT